VWFDLDSFGLEGCGSTVVYVAFVLCLKITTSFGRIYKKLKKKKEKLKLALGVLN
jgi:hypothetical protein